MDEAKMRELFETWCKDEIRAAMLPLERYPNDAYVDSRTYIAWYTFKNSIALLEQ